MNISWDNPYEWAWVAHDEDNPDGWALFSMCKRGAGDIRDNHAEPRTRWIVCDGDSYDGYCGDVPIELPLEEAQAMAIALWRLREQA